MSKWRAFFARHRSLHMEIRPQTIGRTAFHCALGSPSFSSYSSRTPEPPANYLSIMLGMAGRSCESGSHSAALPRLAHFSAAAASLSRTQYPPFCSLQLTPDYPWSCHHSAGSLKDALQGMPCLSTACRQPGEVSGAHMRLTSACGLTSRLDAQGQLRVQLSGKNPGQLHHELADHHHQARQTLPGIGGCVVAAQTHFRSPSLLPLSYPLIYTLISDRSVRPLADRAGLL